MIPSAAFRLGSLSLIMVAAVAGTWMSGCTYRPGRGPVQRDPLADQAPAWVNNPPLSSRMVYTVGGAPGHDREAAIAEARQNLAKHLHIVIDGDSAQTEDFGTPDFQRPATLHLKSLDLPGVSVAKEEQTGTAVYVMLAFDRGAWAESLRRRLATLDARIRDALLHPPAAPTALAAIAKRHLLLRPLVDQRDELFARLLVADAETPVGPATISVERLRNDLAGALAGMSVNLNLDGNLEGLEPGLVLALGELGLTTGGADSKLRMDLSLRYDRSIADGLDRAEGAFIASVSRSDRRPLGSLTTRIRGTANTPDAALERLKLQVVKRWRDYLDNGFVECLTRL